MAAVPLGAPGQIEAGIFDPAMPRHWTFLDLEV